MVCISFEREKKMLYQTTAQEASFHQDRIHMLLLQIVSISFL